MERAFVRRAIRPSPIPAGISRSACPVQSETPNPLIIATMNAAYRLEITAERETGVDPKFGLPKGNETFIELMIMEREPNTAM